MYRVNTYLFGRGVMTDNEDNICNGRIQHRNTDGVYIYIQYISTSIYIYLSICSSTYLDIYEQTEVPLRVKESTQTQMAYTYMKYKYIDRSISIYLSI